MQIDSKIFVAGHRGLVGSALLRVLTEEGYWNTVVAPHSALDLTCPESTNDFFYRHKPEYVFLCAAKVGGIKAHGKDPVGFFMNNFRIQENVIFNAARHGVKKLVFLGSSCIYPRLCPQPIKEEYLLTGPLEPSNEQYALAKICGVRMCKWLKETRGLDFVSAMPCNLYGRGDSLDPENSHIVPGLISRMYRARINREKTFKVWGDGTAKREFLYSDDLARALLVVADKYTGTEHINTGSGDERTVRELAYLIKDIVGYFGELVFDDSQPTGTPRKVMDNSKIFELGWRPRVGLEQGLMKTFRDVCHRMAP